MQMQICHSLVLAVIALGGFSNAAPQDYVSGNGNNGCGRNIALQAEVLQPTSVKVLQPAAVELVESVPVVKTVSSCRCNNGYAKRQCDCPLRGDTIQPCVTEVAQPIVHESEDVQPVDIIQPVEEVVQPVIDERIKPIHSQTTKDPIVNTTQEPCRNVNCASNKGYNNGYSKRQCNCPPRCKTIEPCVTEIAQPIVHESEDVQPVDIIQPVKDVVQPVIDERIKPIHSQTTKDPIVNTTHEPCCAGGCNCVHH